MGVYREVTVLCGGLIALTVSQRQGRRRRRGLEEAVGETAAAPHGADRLGGNMLVGCQVFGRRAGHLCSGKGLRRDGEPRRPSH